MRVKDCNRRDFACYLRWRRETPEFVPRAAKLMDQGSASTIECFVRSENGETNLQPRHPRALRAAMEGKRSLNAQIKDWAVRIADCYQFGPAGRFIAEESLRELYTDRSISWLPDWVWHAVSKQAARLQCNH